MSLIKAIRQQLGLSVTPGNNFTLDASADNGTMKLARGNAGATTQDIMTVDAAGKVAFPQMGPVILWKVFSATMPLEENQAVMIPHNVDPLKIISMTAVVQATGNELISPGDPHARISVFGNNATNVGVYIIPGGVTNYILYGRPVYVTIQYLP